MKLWESFRQPLTCGEGPKGRAGHRHLENVKGRGCGGRDGRIAACARCRLTAAAGGCQAGAVLGARGTLSSGAGPAVVWLCSSWLGTALFHQGQVYLGWGLTREVSGLGNVPPWCPHTDPRSAPGPQHLPERHEGIKARHPHREVPHDQARTRQTQRAQPAEVSEPQGPGQPGRRAIAGPSPAAGSTALLAPAEAWHHGKPPAPPRLIPLPFPPDSPRSRTPK